MPPLSNTVAGKKPEKRDMGIDSESDIEADLQIGPTSLGMVRIFVSAPGIEIPMDFSPDEALEIAEELRASAERARNQQGKKGRKKASPA